METHHEDAMEGIATTTFALGTNERSRFPSNARPRQVTRSNNGPEDARSRPACTSQAHRALAIKTILVPTDFSPLAVRALTYARRFAEDFGAELILLHVMDPVAYAPAYCPLESVEELRSARRQAAEDSLAQLIADSESPRGRLAPWRAIVAEGDSASETDRIARENAVDLIVIASHGFGGLTHLLLGSTTEKIVRQAPCPVLVVRANQRDFSTTTSATP